MIVLFFQAIILYVVSSACWKLVRLFVTKTALDNIPGPPASSFLQGNFKDLFADDAWDFHKSIAEKYGSVIRTKAFLGENQLYIFDPKSLHYIFLKDQNIYEESPRFLSINRVFFGEGLVATLGEQHRKQRKMLNPVFSVANMRHMVPLFWSISQKLLNTLEMKVKDGPQEIDVTHWISRTALELVGQTGLGYSFDSLGEDSTPHPYSVAIKQLLPVSNSRPLQLFAFYVLPTVINFGSPRFQRWVVDTVPWKTVHKLRDVIDVIENTSVEVLETKMRALRGGDEAMSKQVARGKDIMSILLRANIEASKEDRLPEPELIAQISTLTFGATDTTSSALSRILYLLSIHPEVQTRLRKEILEARKHHGNLDYDELMSLPYLDAVYRETLRLYPPLTRVQRKARKDVILPLSCPVKGLDGCDIHEILVPKNTNLIISILAANRNPDVWGPDSFEWKPERWLSSLPDSVVEAHLPGIYSHLMTFVGGGRACIGFKFAELEIKIVLSSLVSSLTFSPSKEIFWRMHSITSPSVIGGDPKHTSLPMIVSLV